MPLTQPLTPTKARQHATNDPKCAYLGYVSVPDA